MLVCIPKLDRGFHVHTYACCIFIHTYFGVPGVHATRTTGFLPRQIRSSRLNPTLPTIRSEAESVADQPSVDVDHDEAFGLGPLVVAAAVESVHACFIGSAHTHAGVDVPDQRQKSTPSPRNTDRQTRPLIKDERALGAVCCNAGSIHMYADLFQRREAVGEECARQEGGCMYRSICFRAG